MLLAPCSMGLDPVATQDYARVKGAILYFLDINIVVVDINLPASLFQRNVSTGGLAQVLAQKLRGHC